MSDQLNGDRRAPSGSFADPGELEKSVRTIRFEELLATLRRHLWLVLGVTGAAVAAAGYMAYTAGPVYRAVAVIRVSDPRRALTGGVVEDPGRRADERFGDPLLSQIELLTSRAVAGAVVDSMPMLRVLTWNLPPSLLREVAVPVDAGADSFQLTLGLDSVVAEGRSGRRSAAYGTAVEVNGIRFAVRHRPGARQGRLRVLSREAAISRLIAGLRVRRRTGTDIVDVAYSDPDRYRAHQVVNRVVDGFRATSAEAAQQQSRLRREFLEAQLKVNDSLLAHAREALTAFRRRAGAYGTAEFLTREQTMLPGIELQRDQLEAERRTYQDLLASLRDSSAGRKALQAALAVPGVAASPAVTQLSVQLFQHEVARDSLASRSVSHPGLPRLNLLISSTEAKLFRAVQAGVQSSIASLDARVAATNDVRARRAGSLQQLSATEAEEARLMERVENARKVADALRVEYQHAGIAEAVTVGQVEIVDRAIVPPRPAGIGLAEQLALGLLLGLAVGAGGAFAADHLRSSVTRRAHIERLGISVLGVVPRCRRRAAENGAKDQDAVIEAFRGIRFSLANAFGDPGPMVVTVTSPGSGDGKSFVSSNLALAFAFANHRTLLVDADLRRGTLHRPLKLRRQPGLTDFLVGDASREQVLQSTTYPSLDFLASGSRRRDAPELMGSTRMADLVATLRSMYTVILLDTPPLEAGVDALVLAPFAGNLVMVLRLGRTDRDVAEAKLDVLRHLPLRLLGTILNDVRNGSEYRPYAYYLAGYDLTNEPLFRPLVAAKGSGRPRVMG